MADLINAIKLFVLAAHEFWILTWHAAVGLCSALKYGIDSFRDILSFVV